MLAQDNRICGWRFVGRRSRWLALSLAAVVASAVVGPAVATADDLTALIDTARESFTPISDEQVAAARAELSTAAETLDRFLVPGSRNGASWQRYLKWDALSEQLAADGSMELAPLVATYRQLNADYTGLGLPPFRRLANALRQYIDLAAAPGAANPAELYATQFSALTDELDRYAQGPDATLALSIGRRLDFIAGLGQAPELVAAVRRRFAKPNAFVNVSAQLLSDAAAEPFERTGPVTDNILGTRIRGDAYTTGTLSVRTLPSDEWATIELTSEGHTESENTGRKGPAVIRSTGHTDFTAVKVVKFSDQEFRSEPAQVDATTNSDIHSVSKSGGGLGQRIVSRVGWNKVRQNHNRADAIATDHSRDRVRQRFDDEVAEKLRKARTRYEDEYRNPLARRGEFPEQVAFRTSESELTFEATQASRGQLAAPDAPPALPDGQDLVVRLHESAVNNYAAAILGGATAREAEPGQPAKFDVKLPPWMQTSLDKRDRDATSSDVPFKPWSLTLRRSRPITVVFADGGVEVTIHLARLTSGGDEFTNWDVTGSFTPELADGGAVLRRQGDLVVLPTGFDADGGGQLSSRQVAIRSNLTKVLNERSAQGRGFPQSIQFEALEPEGDLAKVGPLLLGQLTADGGWLTLAWNRQ